jgi:hypothetical protein
LFKLVHLKKIIKRFGSQKGQFKKGESRKAIAFLARPVAFLADAFLFFFGS